MKPSPAAAESRAFDAAGGECMFDLDAWPGILSGLVGVNLSGITMATGRSKGLTSGVRAGKPKPHPSHWPALAKTRQHLGVAKVTTHGKAGRSRVLRHRSMHPPSLQVRDGSEDSPRGRARFEERPGG
jgi:hypothetical protein